MDSIIGIILNLVSFITGNGVVGYVVGIIAVGLAGYGWKLWSKYKRDKELVDDIINNDTEVGKDLKDIAESERLSDKILEEKEKEAKRWLEEEANKEKPADFIDCPDEVYTDTPVNIKILTQDGMETALYADKRWWLASINLGLKVNEVTIKMNTPGDRTLCIRVRGYWNTKKIKVIKKPD